MEAKSRHELVRAPAYAVRKLYIDWFGLWFGLNRWVTSRAVGYFDFLPALNRITSDSGVV